MSGVHFHRHAAWLVALSLLLAFAFIGSRPLWDPDEGRYSNVALNMLASGDWLHPMRSEEAGHWTKPPLTYWAAASSFAVFGSTPGAARVPVALAYLASVWLAWRLARRLAPGREHWAGLAFATMLLPALVSQVLTTDFLLAAWCGLAMLAFAELQWGLPERQRLWRRILWLAFGFGFLTKGPPALLPVLGLVLFRWLQPREQRPALGSGWGVMAFVVIAFGWFAVVTWQHPQLLRYFVGEEVVERVAGHGFGRNTGPLGWLKIYLPTLLVGSLPWWRPLWRGLRQGFPGVRLSAWRSAAADPARAMDVWLWCWLLPPLVVLSAASSRLPLYVLPLFLPLAVMVARASPASRWWRWMLPLWVALLLGMRGYAATVPTEADAAAYAAEIRERINGPIAEVVFVDQEPRYGLHLHLGAEVEHVELGDNDATAIAHGDDHSLAHELFEREADVVYVTPLPEWPSVGAFAAAHGYIATPRGTALHGSQVFTVAPDSPPSP